MQRTLGNSGFAVNAIGLGAMPLSIQGRPDERTAHEVIAAFLEAGGNLIDTANTYCLDDRELGHNERLIAKTLASLGRRDVVVATKGGLRRPGGRWEVDGDPAWLRRSCEQSVRDLGGEPIALYYLHAVDSQVPFEESLGELVRLKDEGKIRNIGLSNVGAAHLDTALGMTPIAAVQNRCNVYERRDVQEGLVARCSRDGIAYVAYSPVGGHYGHRRLGKDTTLMRIGAKHAVTPYLVALAWLLGCGEHVVPIPGASRIESARASLEAVEVALDADDRLELTEVV